jgi:hypothetical protein
VRMATSMDYCQDNDLCLLGAKVNAEGKRVMSARRSIFAKHDQQWF